MYRLVPGGAGSDDSGGGTERARYAGVHLLSEVPYDEQYGGQKQS